MGRVKREHLERISDWGEKLAESVLQIDEYKSNLKKEVIDNLSGCDILVIETNHDRNMLLTGPYPRSTKQRIDSDLGHLSNEHAAGALPEIVGERTRQLVLAHLSETNNMPRLARAAAEGAMRYAGIDGITLHTASQRTPSGRIACD